MFSLQLLEKIRETSMSSKDGVLSHLEKLEARARKLALEQREVRQQQENVARLQGRLQELRGQKDELKTKLALCRSGLTKGQAASGSSTPEAETSRQVLVEWKMRNAKALLHLFHLTGLTGKQTRKGVCLCISTAYEGVYLDSYYLDLLVKQPVRIRRHSIPPFIPLNQISDEYLQTDIRRFLAVLSEHLNAYAGRKFQAEQLQEHFAAFLGGPMQGNSLCNRLEFSYSLQANSKTFPFTATLTYTDATRILPTEVTVVCKEAAPASEMEMAAGHSALFREKPLPTAFQSFASLEEENLSQAVPLELSVSSSVVPSLQGRPAAPKPSQG